MIHKGQRLSSVTSQNVGNRLQNHQISRNIFVFTLVLINYLSRRQPYPVIYAFCIHYFIQERSHTIVVYVVNLSSNRETWQNTCEDTKMHICDGIGQVATNHLRFFLGLWVRARSETETFLVRISRVWQEFHGEEFAAKALASAFTGKPSRSNKFSYQRFPSNFEFLPLLFP
jgi:hypothetical protein